MFENYEEKKFCTYFISIVRHGYYLNCVTEMMAVLSRTLTLCINVALPFTFRVTLKSPMVLNWCDNIDFFSPVGLLQNLLTAYFKKKNCKLSNLAPISSCKKLRSTSARL